MVDIVNISAGGDLHREIDVEEVRDTVDLAFVDYNETVNRLLLRYEEDGALLILFRTGKFILRGGDSYDGCYEARDTFYEVLSNHGVIDSTENVDFDVENIVCVGDLGEEVDLSDLALELGLDYTEYGPEQFPALIYRPPDSDPTMNIYSTGKVTITGCRMVETAEDTMSKLQKRLLIWSTNIPFLFVTRGALSDDIYDNGVSDEDEFKITEEERENLVASDVEEFPFDPPKYTTYLLNDAINLSQSNRPHVVGQMNEIVDEFREENPDGTFEDWVKYYNEEYDGEDRLIEATEMAYPMVEKMRDAFDQIDVEMTHQYLRDLVLFKSYEGFDIEETILKKLGEMYDEEITKSTADEESKGIDGYIGDQPVQIKPETYKDKLSEDIPYPIVFYDENKTNKTMNVDISQLNEVMGED